MRLTDNVTDEIKQRLDIVDVVSRYVSLRRNGSVYRGLCPFHTEQTPSFVVFPHTGTWRCFGACGFGGDIFTFVMRRENLDFREALQLLAKEAGVELAAHDDPSDGSARDALYAVNATAMSYYVHVLEHHTGAEGARRYLVGRGIDQATSARFGLGYALDVWTGLRDYLLEQGHSLDLLLEAGLVKRSEEHNRTFDMFRNRLIFPIRDRQGRVIGFGGRVLGDGLPKYLNTAETPLFHKSHVVYGLDLAQRTIREQEQVVIVEGYMDVIAAHQHGFTNVVACMGTALTSDQLHQLQRHTDNFVLALDADTAGQQATIRGLNQARSALSRVAKPTVTATGGVRVEQRLGANLFITTMPEGLDPDDVIRRDPGQWQQAVDAAEPLVDFYFDMVSGSVDLTTALGKGQVVAELTPLIAELSDEVERQHYVQRLSRLVQVDEITIASRVQASARTLVAGKGGRRARRFLRSDGPDLLEPAPNAHEENTPKRAAQHSQEDHLLANLLSEGSLLIWLAGLTERTNLAPLGIDDWQNAENREIFRSLKLYLSGDELWDLELFQETLNEALHGRLARLLAYAAKYPQQDLASLQEDTVKVLLRMRMTRLKTETRNIKYLLDELQQAGDREEVRSFDRINNHHLRDLAHLQTVLAQLPQELNRRALAVPGIGFL